EIPSDSQDRLDLEKAKDDLVVLDAECTVEHPVLVEEKTFEAKILIRNSKKPFKSYFVPLTPKPAEDEQWDKSKNYKKVKLGKPQRDYSDSWRFYVENFLFQNSEGFIMPMGHEEMDMFIPTKVLNDNSDPASLSKLRHKIYNIVSRYFSAMQYVALLRFCKRKTIKKFESDNDLIDHVQKVAKILRINLTKEQAKQIRYLKTMALEVKRMKT
uniref:Uncharacterized protein n=1 Tax=Romanomermis culicivorax TaxID=13658 RepID=A0A915JEA4_ROMCU